MSDLPSSIDYSTMANVIAWEIAKITTNRLREVTREELLKAILDDFVKARYTILNKHKPDEEN